ncbi:MAG: hypothetical protein WCF85_19880 [Rhodospirillaceae bacterium]
MPLDIGALLNSDFNAMTRSDTAWRAGVTLWLKAWHQVPAGSLPNDERALCFFAGFGRDLRRWRKLSAEALHGFVLCSDGRLYHRFLCKLALDARDKHDTSLARREAALERDRARKSGKPAENDGKAGGSNPDDTGNSTPLQNTTLHHKSNPPTPRSGGPDRTNVRQEGRRFGRQRDTANREPAQPEPGAVTRSASDDEIAWRCRLSNGPGGLWLSSWGPRPDEPHCEAPHCEAPQHLIAASPWHIELRQAA